METPLAKAWKTYQDTTGHRFFDYTHLVIILGVYELLGFFTKPYNPESWAYFGSDLWYKLAYLVPMHTLLFSLFIMAYYGYLVVLDLRGIKDRKEKAKDAEALKKDKNFKPKPKDAYKPNWYYFGYIVIEGFVYGTLMMIFMPEVIFAIVNAILPDLKIPLPIDQSRSLHDYLTSLVLNMAMAFGGGAYEELIFRGFIFTGIIFLGKKLPFFKDMNPEMAPLGIFTAQYPKYKGGERKVWITVLFAAVVYSVSHYLPPGGDPFNLYTFVYRIVFGVVMYLIVSRRKFSIAMWAHIWYDLWYFLFT
ncbi:MAG: CPBP family glutamic-type intramembrane protease [Bacteroidia bacterium]|nr:CPBP family glutamic-type intramembrane protease [Bacteroidia bacterium]